MQTIEADYLVIGAGAMGMAFTDTLVSETAGHLLAPASGKPRDRILSMTKSALSATAGKLDEVLCNPSRY